MKKVSSANRPPSTDLAWAEARDNVQAEALEKYPIVWVENSNGLKIDVNYPNRNFYIKRFVEGADFGREYQRAEGLMNEDMQHLLGRAERLIGKENETYYKVQSQAVISLFIEALSTYRNGKTK